MTAHLRLITRGSVNEVRGRGHGRSAPKTDGPLQLRLEVVPLSTAARRRPLALCSWVLAWLEQVQVDFEALSDAPFPVVLGSDSADDVLLSAA